MTSCSLVIRIQCKQVLKPCYWLSLRYLENLYQVLSVSSFLQYLDTLVSTAMLSFNSSTRSSTSSSTRLTLSSNSSNSSIIFTSTFCYSLSSRLLSLSKTFFNNPITLSSLSSLPFGTCSVHSSQNQLSSLQSSSASYTSPDMPKHSMHFQLSSLTHLSHWSVLRYCPPP